MKKRIFSLALVLLLALALCGCGETESQPPALTNETAVYEGDGYRLTYPACFELVGETEKMVSFSVSGGNMVFSVTAEPNPYGLQKIEDYPDLMGIYSGVKILSDQSFGVEKYLPDVLSAYYLYAFSADTTYLLEYNYGGTEEQREMSALFAMEVE